MSDADSREGALIRVQFEDGSTGYGDCFPWPELGDSELAVHLGELAQGKMTSLVAQTFLSAKRDAKNRSQRLNPLAGLPNVRNHFLVPDLLKFSSEEFLDRRKEGFSTFKVKVGNDLLAEAVILKKIFTEPLCRLRLDFNSRGSLGSFRTFIAELGPEVSSKVEFVEDPFPFDQQSWSEASSLVPLALDNEYKNVNWDQLSDPPFSVLVIKPARQNVNAALEICSKYDLKAVVTSALDHPVGVINALITAAELKRDFPDLMLDAGCLSFHIYERNDFSAFVRAVGPSIQSFNFESVIENLNWKLLCSLEAEVLLNPRLSEAERIELLALAKKYPQPDGVWIASSGSSRSEKNSVKLVALSREALWASARAVNKHLGATSRDIWAQVLPRFHVGGLGIEIRAELSQSTVIGALRNDKSDKWDPEYFVDVCNQHEVTLSSLVPTQVYDLLANNLKPPGKLRAILVGGAAMSEELYARARQAGWPVLPSYGLTEAGSTVAVAPMESLLASDDSFPYFKVLSHLDVTLSSDRCIEIRGESLLTGSAQWSDGESKWTLLETSAGHVKTEDLGELTAEGLRVLGRQGDFVKVLGEGVNLVKLRTLLEEFDAKSSFILDLPDQRRGVELVLVVESSVNEADREKILTDFNSRVVPFERLQRIHEVTVIPRSSLGKVSRAELVSAVMSL
jgi:O-succinylbenzoic acid--CoA ligase